MEGAQHHSQTLKERSDKETTWKNTGDGLISDENPTVDCFASLAMTFFLLQFEIRIPQSAILLGAPTAEVSFSQINLLGGYPGGGVGADRRRLA
jgi:hypothetical protein